MEVQTRINTKHNTVRETQPQTPERQVQQAEETPETPQSNESSPLQFNTPNSKMNVNVLTNSWDRIFRSPITENQLPLNHNAQYQQNLAHLCLTMLV